MVVWIEYFVVNIVFCFVFVKLLINVKFCDWCGMIKGLLLIVCVMK